MEIKKTIKPEIRLDSKKRILIVSLESVTTHSTLQPTLQPIGKASRILKPAHNLEGLRLKRLREFAAGKMLSSVPKC